MNSFENYDGGASCQSVSQEVPKLPSHEESRLDARFFLLNEVKEQSLEKERREKKEKEEERKEREKEKGLEKEQNIEIDPVESENISKGEEISKEEAIFRENILRSQWLKNTVKYILEYRGDPDEMEDFWSDFDEAFASNEESIKKYVEMLKYEALTQAAAQSLIMDLKEEIAENTGNKINVKIEIEPSTPEEELNSKVDFWVDVEFNGRKNRLPCQAICIDSDNKKLAHNGDKGKTRRSEGDMGREKFFRDNYINCNYPKNAGGYVNKKTQKMLEDFYRENPKGITVFLPKDKILDDGRVEKNTRKNFMGNATDKERAFWFEFIP